MTMPHPKVWIATFAVTVVAAGASPARADSKNEIRSVTFDQDAGTTHIRVRGAQTPTFTVYKLERPSRVVLDVPQARLAEALRGHEGAAVFTPNTWAVSTIAAQQLDDGGQLVRVIITLARPGRYDVKTDGNEVVVMVTSRDPAPKVTSPHELAKAQAEGEQARRAAMAAEQARVEAERTRGEAQAEAASARDAAAKAQAEAASAKTAAASANSVASKATSEAERLRKAAADQMARAQAAQRAADDARRSGQQASAADIERAKSIADAARGEAATARAEAARANAAAAAAQGDADRMRVAAERAKREALSEAERARSAAELAKRDIAQTRGEVDAARAAAAKELDAAARATADAAVARREADAARSDAARTRAEALAAKDAATRTKAQAEASRLEAEAARSDSLRIKAEAEAARLDADKARRDATTKRMEAEQARTEASKAKDDIARTNASAARARSEAEAARADAAQARSEAQAARAEAEAAKLVAADEKRQAEADKQRAVAARGDAERLLKQAKAQLAAIDSKALAVQALEDKARATHAAAQAREAAARETVRRTQRETVAAADAAERAAVARDRSQGQLTSDREKLILEAKAAEDRLARARRATDDAEQRRIAAETAATNAKRELESTRTTLATVEQQRTAAETAASMAARKRGEAEAAATDATRRRTEAEIAAASAAKQRAEAERGSAMAAKHRSEAEQQRAAAETQRKAAEAGAREAQVAKLAADKQREISEAAARGAVAAKHSAERGLEELMARRQAAEHAASELEARSMAEARAQAELVAARARKASDNELAKTRAEATRLADQRRRAEIELADRRKAVAAQQGESDRLKTAAAQARDAAEREEVRRAKLAELRATEEAELAKLTARRLAATRVATVHEPIAKPKLPATSAFVRDISFKGEEGSGQVDIALTGDATITLGPVTRTRAELIIDGAELASKLERKLDVTKFGSPVRAVSSFRDPKTPNRVRLIVDLIAPATPSFDRNSTGVRWRLSGNDMAMRSPRTQNVPSPIVGGFGAASTPIAQQSVSQVPAQGVQGGRNRKVYRGATVDFDFKDAPIHDLLRTIADTGKVNIVVPDGINAKVTVRLKRVPWDQALEVILSSHGLWYRRDGNLYRIAPRKELDDEDEAEAARREAMIKAESPRPEVVPLNYASAAELSTKLESMLSPKGRIEVDDRTNALIINDVGGNREQIARLALSLDRQTPQISIEARIVEARSTFIRQIGVQWGGRAVSSAAGGNATGLVWPSSISLLGANEDNATNRTGVANPSDFAVNLPAATGSGEGGALGLSLGSVGGNFNVNLRLSALEDSGTVRIISAPKITVLNNKQASISQGVSIPISVTSANGTTTQFVQADLSLVVTPYVSQRDCAIAMNLVVSKNEPDFVNTGARGDPTILRKEAKTSMLVADGETSVLGGIYTRNSGVAYRKIPLLGDLPVLGWLFKSRRENDDRTEILVFITPKITNRALLGCQ